MSTLATNTLSESNAKSINKISKVNVVLAVIYGLMIAFVVFIYKLLEYALYTQHGGLGGVSILIFFGGFLLIFWFVLSLISSIVMIVRKKHWGVTIAIVSVGMLSSLIPVIILFYLFMMSGGYGTTLIGTFTSISSILFILVGFIMGAGLATFVIFVFDVILFTIKQIIEKLRQNALEYRAILESQNRGFPPD